MNFRSPMKFSIREIMLVTVIVALAVAWYVDHAASKAREQESRHDAEVLGQRRVDDAGRAREERAPRPETERDRESAAERLDQAPIGVRLPQRPEVRNLPALSARPLQ